MAKKEAKLTPETERIDQLTAHQPQSTGPMQPMQIASLRRRSLRKGACDDIRFRRHVLVEGEGIPPPISAFQDLPIPSPNLSNLWVNTGIGLPTPIQMQALPVIFSGRDMIGVAPAGSGKTFTLALPLVCFSLQEERREPLRPGMGPVGVLLIPSEEHARRTLDWIEKLDSGYPPLRSMICTSDLEDCTFLWGLWEHWVHIVVATPHQLKEMLERRKVTLDSCVYLALDGVDRLLDLGFEDDILEILGRFKAQRLRAQRQTVMFSATMPKRVKKFAETVLVRPVVVKVTTAGSAADLNVVQVVEYVKQVQKLVYLAQTTVQKTPPPVLIFCEKEARVDRVLEHLLCTGSEAVAIYGGQDQKEREYAISSFKAGYNDVLMTTDDASNGVDFPDVRHVINYDMPAKIEKYVSRIGRTGRCGTTGLATSFINEVQPKVKVLLALKQLLKETKQGIPPMLAALDDPLEVELEDQLSSTDGV